MDCAQQCGAHAIFTASSVLNWDNQTFWICLQVFSRTPGIISDE